MDTNGNAKKAAFLSAYAECATVRRAAEAAGISTTSHYRWLESDPEYVAAFEEAERLSVKSLEEEARRRAYEGCRRLKFDGKGNVLIDPATGEPYEELQYSDTLMIFLLKGAAPDKYRERMDTNVNGKVELSGEITHKHSLEALLGQTDYVGYLRHRTSHEDCDSGAICQIREPGNGKPVENGTPHGGAGPGANGHRNGSE